LFVGLPIELVAEEEAEAVIATGLFNDEQETPADYADLLARLNGRKLPMICANPDVVVHRGDRLIWCAGALARDYAALGGEVRMAGKPYAAIYAVAAEAAGVTDPARVLCIGDGLNTDIRGAVGYGADALLVVGGIHGEELGGAGVAPEALATALAEQNLSARYFMYALG
ncbi:MAG: TIGR01459 family HAD-type hydrolase, partial [Sphingomonas sp.]